MADDWDYHLEEEAARIACEVRERGFPAASGTAPVFLAFDGGAARLVCPRRVADSFAVAGELPGEFVEALRRTDHPPGSFFVLAWSGSHYQWSYYS